MFSQRAIWSFFLIDDFDNDFLMSGICHGFDIVPDVHQIKGSETQNYNSALNPISKPILDKLFRDEIKTNRFSKVNFKPIKIQSIGAVPKKAFDIYSFVH